MALRLCDTTSRNVSIANPVHPRTPENPASTVKAWPRSIPSAIPALTRVKVAPKAGATEGRYPTSSPETSEMCGTQEPYPCDWPSVTTSTHAKSTLQTVSSDAKLNPSAQPAASWMPRDPTLPPRRGGGGPQREARDHGEEHRGGAECHPEDMDIQRDGPGPRAGRQGRRHF